MVYIIDLAENLVVGINKLKRGTVLGSRDNSVLVSNCLSGIRSVNRIYLDQLNEINQSVITLQDEGFGENSPAIKSLLFKRGSLTGKPLLGYLAEKLFLPNANMPTGVVEFDITNIDTIQRKINSQQRHQGEITQEDNSNFSVVSENPSFHLARALAEYAPGRQIVLNQYCYTSDGIQLKSIWNEQNMLRVQKCTNGHTTLSMFDKNICHCGSPLHSVHGTGRFTEAIEPAGFSVDIRKEPSRVIDNDQLSIVETELINVSDWGEDAGVFKIESRSSLSDSEIMYYNNGNGFGYAVCIHCGRAEKETEIASPGDGKLHNHKRLRGGKDNDNSEFCTGSDDNAFGIRRNNLLIGRLQTDFVELRFHNNNGYIDDKETVRSLGVVLSQALAQSLGINESEISFGLKRYQGYFTAYIYDTAKGGAGYSNQFNYYIEDILQRARTRLTQCDCSKACTKCLINRSSQWYLDELDRFKALDWLNIEYETRAVVPEEIRAISPNAKQVTKEIGVEIQRWLDRSSSEEFTIFIDNHSSSWNDTNWGLIDKAKEFKFVTHKTVNFIILGTANNDLVTFSIVKGLESWANVFVMDLPTGNELVPLATIRMQSQETATYQNFYSQRLNNQFNESWGKNELVFTDERENNYEIRPYTPQIETNSNLDRFYITKRRTTSSQLVNVFVESLIERNSSLWNKIESAFNGKEVTIAYSDRYIISKFSAMLTLQFIQTLSEKLNLEIESLQLNLKRFEEKDRICLKIYDNWNTNVERNTFVRNAILDMNIVSEDNMILNVSNRLSHYRQLVIESDSHVLTIQPDGGIAHGWRYDKNFDDYNDGDYDMVECDEDIRIKNHTGDNGIQYFVEFE